VKKYQGYIAMLNDRPILASLRATLPACMDHLAEELGLTDRFAMAERGYTFHAVMVHVDSAWLESGI
jgi:hypothetical protein